LPIDVVLVDDHAMVREGLRGLLEAHGDMRVVGAFGDAEGALAFCKGSPPHVAVIDVTLLPGLDGIETARRMHDACPDTNILMLSMHAGPEHIYQAMQAGATGYVLKESAGAELVAAIRAARTGRLFLSEKVSVRYQEYSSARAGHPLERISARERQVLTLVVDGHTSAEVALMLGLSPKSVDTYRSRLMAKLHIDDLPGLVKFAIRHGITTA
jgi:DNA-binding NarL/FixJ family response regulator